MQEPCLQTQEQCCAHKHEHGASAFTLDDSGCCNLLFIEESGSIDMIVDKGGFPERESQAHNYSV